MISPKTTTGEQAVILPAGAPSAAEHAEKFFGTSHLLANLRNHAISSGFITLASQIAVFILNLLSTIVLARLLTPKDFGLVAMVITVTSFLGIFREAGLSTATIQREGITHAQVSNLFWINLGIGGLLSLLVAALAPVIAWFYGDSRLIGITLLISMTFFLMGSAVQHMALLNRQMAFKKIAVVEVGSMFTSVAVGIGMAWFGYGYWSIVGANIGLALSKCLLAWTASRWRPTWPKRRSGTRPMLGFGATLTFTGFLYFLTRGADSLLIGRFYGADSVGLYSRALALLNRPIDQLLGPISSVFLPALSRMQGEPNRYRQAFLRTYEAIALVCFPFTGLMFALAHPIVGTLLGPKWQQAGTIFAAFSLAALESPMSISATWLYTTQGRSKDILMCTIITSLIIAVAFVVGLPYGPFGVAFAYSLSGLTIRVPVLYYYTGRSGPVRTRDLWRVFVSNLPVWIIAAGSAFLADHYVQNLRPILQLLICTPVSLLAVLASIFVLPVQRRAAMHLLKMITETVRSRRLKTA